MSHRLTRFLSAGAIALALLGSAAATAHAQGATVIAGRVVSKTGSPIQGATVVVDGTQIGTTAAEDGRYSLTVPAGRTGSVNVTARFIGYRALRIPVTLNGARVGLDFTLTSQPTQLNEVVVTALS